MADAGISLRQAIAETAQRLQACGIERPRPEARLLAAKALATTIEKIVADDARILAPAELQALRRLAALRAERRPMAQILGQREFFGRRFEVTPDVLTPRPDSETMIEAVLAQIADRDAPMRVLELGVGSGCLLLTLLAELKRARGLGIDVSGEALAVAGRNAAALGLSPRCELVQGDWSQPVCGGFDLLLSNPPYIPSAELAGLQPEVARHEPRLALDGGVDGLVFHRRLAEDGRRLLVPGGLLAVEIGAGQGDAVAGLLQEAGLAIRERRHDLAGLERCILARKP
ncbi:MAG: peptide chain release factor N(5)-glutamine methyltransferase [Reyranellaceae bacterium]